jgi:hypothetical protein
MRWPSQQRRSIQGIRCDRATSVLRIPHLCRVLQCRRHRCRRRLVLHALAREGGIIFLHPTPHTANPQGQNRSRKWLAAHMGGGLSGRSFELPPKTRARASIHASL